MVTSHIRSLVRVGILLVAAFLIGNFTATQAFLNGTSTGITTVAAQQEVAPSSSVFTQVYDQVSPSVVAISVLATARDRVIGSGVGTGFVFDSEGHIVTNDHVVSNVSSIEVEFYDGTLAQATVVGMDEDSDLAVLQVDVPSEILQPVQFGNSDALQVGQTVLALGSPFGQDWTLTSGIISALNRTISGLDQFSIGGVIQTDAAINPGNSGGPLLDLSGAVIGVNSQIQTTSSVNSGVGFAIPGNLVQRVAQSLIDNGGADYSYIGISGTDVTLSVLQTLNLPHNTRGVIVSDVFQGGPADLAGLSGATISPQNNNQISYQDLDIITAVDSVAIKGMSDLISYLSRSTVPGQTVTLSVLRGDGQLYQLPVVLTARP
ncbi:MAG: trypsin-like peptidase domain-containing protein [Anaerolineae bacterium]|nr:trypsin-like peptidase domain-containing protein [Anaerolineae bacterium]